MPNSSSAICDFGGMGLNMLFKDITVLYADGQCREHMYVGVTGQRISCVTDDPGSAAWQEWGCIIPGEGRLLMPGMFNTHTHVPMTLMRGYGEDMVLSDWLFNCIFPFEAHLTGDDVYWGSLLGMAEMLASGTVSITDMYYFCDRIAQAAECIGIKANVGRAVSCNDPAAELLGLTAGNELRALVPEYHGKADGRILIDAAVHAEYTTHPNIIRQCARLADELGLRMQVHLSETGSEHKECVGRWGKTPAAVMRDAGLFNLPVTAAHCVWLTDSDMDILAQHSVNVAHCPQSNLKLACGIAQTEKMRAKGINVTFGTDSAASNNNLNLLEEARAAAMLAKGVSLNPCALPAPAVMHMLTRAGALAQGRSDCGDIKEGYRADFAVFDMTAPCMIPCHDAAANILYSSNGDVYMTVVDGRIVYENGEFPFIDIRRVKHEVSLRAQRIAAQCGSGQVPGH